jgi:hypothetical protein
MAAVPNLVVPDALLAGPEVSGRALSVFERVETLPSGASGMLRYGPYAVVLVEARSVCFAAAPGMRNRLTTLLRELNDPPLDRDYLEDLYRTCRHQAAFIDALLANARVSPAGLRAALMAHTLEAISHIATSDAPFEEFVPNRRYNARFSFSTAELLATIGARRDRQRAERAHAELAQVLVPQSAGWAFLRDSGAGTPLIIASGGKPPPATSEMLDLSSWAAGLFDVSLVFDDDVRVAAASFAGAEVVAWRAEPALFVAKCENRAAVARLISVLDARHMPETGR